MNGDFYKQWLEENKPANPTFQIWWYLSFWTFIKIHVKKDAKVSTKTTEHGTTIYCEPPKDVKTSVMTQKQLTDAVRTVVTSVTPPVMPV